MEPDESKTAQTTWTIDPMHTTVGFCVRHLMITNLHGVFDSVGGTVVYDEGRPELAAIEVDIPAAAINTRQPQRDAHLRSPEFFDAERHPTITFRTSRVRPAVGGALEVTGNLTIRGTTREVILSVVEVSGERKDHNGATRRGASATTTIKRSDFGMTYNRVLEAGGVAVADDVLLTIDVSLVKGERR